MGIFGMVLVNEKEYEGLRKSNLESNRVKNLEKQRDQFKTELKEAEKNPAKFLRGRRYSPQTVRDCIKTLKICENTRLKEGE